MIRSVATLTPLTIPTIAPRYRDHRITERQTAMSLFEGNRQGFSLFEIIVAMSVIGLLLAIGIPAISRARETARSTECKNHLRQIGTALQNHQSQFGRLPEDGRNGYGFGAFLLPALDQGALYDKLQPQVLQLAPGTPADELTTGVILDVFRCPSFPGGDRLETTGYGRSSYLGTTDLFSEGLDLSHVIDGESLTIAAGETSTDHGWALPGAASCDVPPNAGGPFGSSHTGGAHFLLCDGAVRWISDSVDKQTFHALGTPAGKESLGDF